MGGAKARYIDEWMHSQGANHQILRKAHLPTNHSIPNPLRNYELKFSVFRMSFDHFEWKSKASPVLKSKPG